jgi:hypothetical protein
MVPALCFCVDENYTLVNIGRELVVLKYRATHADQRLPISLLGDVVWARMPENARVGVDVLLTLLFI